MGVAIKEQPQLLNVEKTDFFLPKLLVKKKKITIFIRNSTILLTFVHSKETINRNLQVFYTTTIYYSFININAT